MKNLFYYYLVLILFSLIFAKGIENNQNTFTAMDGRENNSPTISVMNINNIAHWIGKDGAYTTAGSPNGTQGDYPIFTGGNIYADGIVWGAKVKNDGQGNDSDIRVGGSTYGHGLKAGRVITDANGNVLGSDDPNNNHVWRVRKDWSVGDLSADAANFFGYSSASDATESEIYTIRGQYEYDWMNWPAAWGAPYEDVDAVQNREWLWRRPYTVLELEHRCAQSNERISCVVGAETGFERLSFRIEDLETRLGAIEWAIQKLAVRTEKSDLKGNHITIINIVDPDGYSIQLTNDQSAAQRRGINCCIVSVIHSD